VKGEKRCGLVKWKLSESESGTRTRIDDVVVGSEIGRVERRGIEGQVGRVGGGDEDLDLMRRGGIVEQTLADAHAHVPRITTDHTTPAGNRILKGKNPPLSGRNKE